MGRYTGPVCRLCRRSGEKLFLKGERCFTPKCGVDRRPSPPGDHAGGRRRRVSERGTQLREKQKARYVYGLLERQFKSTYDTAVRIPGVTGQLLFGLLERRLDNVVFRLGFADSRKQARQLVLHGHLLVNGKTVNIPSYRTKVGDEVTWKELSTKTEYYAGLQASMKGKVAPSWLNLDVGALKGTVLSLPEPTEIDTKIQDRLIVEYYSR